MSINSNNLTMERMSINSNNLTMEKDSFISNKNKSPKKTKLMARFFKINY